MHSNNYTLGFVFIVTLILGTMLSFTKDSVKVLQEQNLKADVQKTILRSLNFDESFVIADVPGIIEGASEGTGLGIAFLKHLSRTRLLLHLVDLGQDITGVETAIEIRKLELDLYKFSDELSKKERWMVFNKTDLISDVDAKSKMIIDELEWTGPIYQVSAATGENIDSLIKDVMYRLKELEEEES